MELSKKKIVEIRKKAEQKNSVFAQKRYLDSMILPSKIIGRETETEKLLSNIMGVSEMVLLCLLCQFMVEMARKGVQDKDIV